MRILLAQNSPYFPAHGGGDKSNRLLMEALAARGHECRVVARIAVFGARQQGEYLAELAARGVEVPAAEGGVVTFPLRGVEVHVAANHPHLRAYFTEQVEAFDPAVILTSTDDPAQVLLEAALRAPRARVVYLVRATLAVPFGPDCAFPSAAKTEILRQADVVVGVSRYVADYVEQHAGIPAVHVPISLLEPGPFPDLGRFHNEFVTLVNPCAVKGISIFLALADRLPDVRFAAVPTWGTTQEDRAALAARPNVALLDPVDNIDLLLARTRVLLVPSLWAEARSRIVLEAMLRGVPVIASHVGGIPEAKMGVPYLLPVRPIERYDARVDEHMVPVAQVPKQDIGPWHAALSTLLSDPVEYERLSAESRRAALAYAENLDAGPFEKVLEQAVEAPRRPRPPVIVKVAEPAFDRLSPDKRRLLELLLRKKAATPVSSAWFPSPGMPRQARLRLFCFPHAGGGAAAYYRWAGKLPGSLAVVPVRLPGRENRSHEPPFRTMPGLVDALGEAILPRSDQPFAFFGHSMGAAVAFELVRWLRQRGLPLPVCLLVSAARAPQFRRGHTVPPEPTEEQFVDELRRLEGMPGEVLDRPDLLNLILPALRADTSLYRQYTYEEEPPLDCPIRAYGGETDPNVRREHLEAWAEQTTGTFRLRLIPGGHFFLIPSETEFLNALADDLAGF